MTRERAVTEGLAEVVVPCAALDETLEFLRERLGFRVEAISPADDPAIVVVSGHGVRLRLDSRAEGEPGTLRLPKNALLDPALGAGAAGTLRAPNGMSIELFDPERPLELPPASPSFELTRLESGAPWKVGRAGMRYRDLIPDRQGGRFIASHIRIETGGPVPDYVHFHRVRFQMIFCYRGWVRVVYESQGAEFVLSAGDSVLQPPGIRHRVLESSAGLEVVEISCPAAHETFADHDLDLPSATIEPEREFDGQRFVRHELRAARWTGERPDGLEARDLGIAAATRGLASASVVRSGGVESTPVRSHEAQFRFVFVLEGSARLETPGRDTRELGAAGAVTLPPGFAYSLTRCSPDFEFLEVTVA